MKKLSGYDKVPVDEQIEEMLWESNAIENERSFLAMDNSIEAWEYAIKNVQNITTKYILKIHKLLAKGIRDDIAGQIRHCDVWIGGYCKYYVSDALIIDQLKTFITALNKLSEEGKRRDEKGKEDLAVSGHLLFEGIHPFQDFNGRVGRLLYNIHRLKMGLPVKIIHEGYEQFEYYKLFNPKIKNQYGKTKSDERTRKKNSRLLQEWRVSQKDR